MKNKYLVIYDLLSKKIRDGYYKTNDLLPSESELMKTYSVSRDTIRKSLNLLTQDGYIQKAQGKGSIVLDINRFSFPVSGVVSFKEIGENLGKDFSTDVKVFRNIFLKDKIQQLLDVEFNEKCWEIFRTRKIDGENIILDKDYILSKVVNNLTKEICKSSIYSYLEDELGLKIAYAKKQITVEKCTDEDRQYLDLKDFNMVVVIRSYTYLDNNMFFQYTESRHRPDRFVFVDFARRNKKI